MRRLLITTALAALVAACGGSDGQAQSARTAAPVDSKPANAPDQKPAFAGQTRAPEVKSNVAVQVTTIAEGLEMPWALAFLPDGRLLITEKHIGQLRILGTDGKLSGPVMGLPAVVGADQGGLLGLAVDPKFAENGLIYWSYAEPAADGTNNTAVARGKLTGDRVENVQVIFHQTPSLNSTKHYGGRLAFAPDGTLFVTTGERSILEGRAQAQRLDGTLGKVVRINSDGSIPKDNPFVGKPGVKQEIWSYGHRNILSAAIDPKTGKLWEVEHGARGGDELNQPQAGKDYGWPTISYGLEYSGKQIGAGLTAKEGMEQPVYYWDPVIAPAGMAFYEADLFPAWKGNILIGGLASKAVVRLVMQDGRVVGEERLLTDLNERIRDVIVGPDGALYLATDSKNGRVLKVTPKG
ncbi:glucose dehydrogenase [Phenylobacterium sp. Root77]|uniref:PQQ-dependent sugar dehydrogenase n=1 Tax=unclassified Phenylobacterium TaxID=2640670 RepID=UPI0006F620A7|nr:MULTISPECIES: PQQ-dependent sugar dehydrogenase [unclassified Phenylobacterium]KQW73533.1 glucose dehydrogenase [Phenylobacterium sp. Root1277]KQW92769.1 glucose dehydrogenase [Phenylobacterium sp. Root1290]KRC41714.1 glucose dehydrogenase [Phenylobacterium sp. Root77]